MSDRYILIGQTPVPCDDLLEWRREMDVDRRVRLTQVGEWFVSTVFLGLDHNFHHWIFGTGEPLLFETMVWKQVPPYCDLTTRFEDDREWKDDIQERCATWLEAERQHVEVIVKIAQPGDEIKQIEPEPLPPESSVVFSKGKVYDDGD